MSIRCQTNLTFVYKHQNVSKHQIMPLRKKFSLPYIFNLTNQNILLNISIPTNPKIKNEISYFELKVETNNERFLSFIFYLKLCFFILSISVFLVYKRKLALQLKPTILIEQKIIYYLGFMLILYNTPFGFYFTEIKHNLAMIEIFNFINISFYSGIIYFWLVSFEIAFSKRSEFKIYQSWWKIILVLMINIYGLVVYIDESLSFLDDPTSVYHKGFYKYWVNYCGIFYKICCIVALLIILFYIFQIKVNFYSMRAFIYCSYLSGIVLAN